MSAVVQRFQGARRDPAVTVLEGFHAVKHAVRFGAELVEVVTTDAGEVARLASDLAPDVAARLAAAEVVGSETLAALGPRAPRTGVMAIARRPLVDPGAVLSDAADRPVVLLEEPRTMGNLGACVRVAAAAGAGGVLSTGTNDPWHPDALRGAAGLHYALPVGRVDLAAVLAGQGSRGRRALVALDPEGDVFDPRALPPRALLAFGTERDGLTGELLDAADLRLRLPMEPGVSSLNLATSVSAVL
ncbi:MAG: hypothetical protein JHD16_14645, partial [Solirubrobacteraceae bacterium]|nr:hypothetical protein [Solirubrobacteraceae bacterium]